MKLFKHLTVLLILFSILSTRSFAHDNIQSGYHFTENRGQFESRVVYHAKLNQGNLFLEKDRFTFDLFDTEELNQMHGAELISVNSDFEGISDPVVRPRAKAEERLLTKKHAYSMIFENSSPNVKITANEKIEGVKNYFKGADQSKWATNVPSFRLVNYSGLYSNIDLEIYSAFEWMKYDFIVHPGGNTNDISIDYSGVDGLYVDHKGDLVVKLSTGDIKEAKLVAYQNGTKGQEKVECKFVVNGTKVTFAFPSGFDHSKDLIIDPVWIFSSLTGSTADNWGFTATYDSQGNLVAAGIAFGSGYPTTTGAYDASYNGNDFDISITKFSPNGTSLIYSTYLGGNDAEAPHSLVNDSQDNLILLATTSSSNFPTTSGVYDQSFNGGWSNTLANMWGSEYTNGTDIAICKFNSGGNLLKSTFIGGTDNEGVNESLVYNYSDQIRGEVVVDQNDDIYVCSSLWSTDFPVTNGSTHSGGQDAIVFKMNSNLSTLMWSTYLGGTGYDAGYSIRENNGKVYVCGGTTSNNIGSTAGVIKPTFGGSWDGYVASFNGSTGAKLALTYLGTTSYDQAFILDTDISGNVYVVGQSRGSYTVTNAAYSNAGGKQFIHKMNPTLTSTLFSTKFGSGSTAVNISPTAFLVDNCGNVYVSGWGGGYNGSSYIYGYDPQAGGNVNNMPLTSDAQQSTTDGNDFYFFVLERDAQSLLYATYFGSSSNYEHTDGGTSRFDPQGVVYQSVCAACSNGNFPTTPGVWASTSGTGSCNMGVIKFEMNFLGIDANATAPADTTVCSSSPFNIPFSSDGSTPSVFWDFGDGNTSTNPNPTNAYVSDGTYTVMFVAIDPNSCNLADTAYFTVQLTQGPTFTANFNLPNIPPCSDPAVVTVNASISGAGIDSTSWNMGDGNIIPDLTTISYSYANEGIYPIEVIAWNLTCNYSDTIRDTLNFLTSVTLATANAPADTTLCSSPPFSIPFTSDGSTPSVYWDFGDGNTSTNANPSNSYASDGTYTVMFVAIDPNTCNGADTAYFNVELIQAPTFSATFNLPTIPPCSDPTVVTVNASISGGGIDSTSWNMGDGNIIPDLTSISYSYTNEGVYPIEVIAYSLACNVSDTIRDTLNFITAMSLASANAPTDTTLCSNPPFDIPFSSDGSTPHVYWDFGDGNNSTNVNPTNSYTSDGIYTVMFVAIDSSTCNIADTAYFDVELIQAPTFTTSFNIPTIPPCSNPTSVAVNANISGTGIDSIVWNMGDGNIISNQTSISYNYSGQGIYTITVTAWDFCGGDTTIQDVFHFISDSSTAEAVDPGDIFLCSSPLNVDFSAGSNPTPYVYWDFGDGLGTSTAYNPTYTYANTGSYVVTFVAIDSNTCNIADTVYFDVTLEQAETFSATLNFTPPPACGSSTALVEAAFTGSGADSLVWDMGNGDILYADSISYLYTTPGIYIVSMTAFDLQCNHVQTISDTVKFVGEIVSIAEVPNVFTPNGDGDNEVLKIPGIDPTAHFYMIIYNRWGRKVFESENNGTFWDGTINGGADAADGVYYYIVKYRDLCTDEDKTVDGHVNLIR
ncbi:MAG: PKD domain-containing protein [Flavobacteriales bacterium]|nr:PKD domain-containing protein [Flavobacteriales bacterium]